MEVIVRHGIIDENLNATPQEIVESQAIAVINAMKRAEDDFANGRHKRAIDYLDGAIDGIAAMESYVGQFTQEQQASLVIQYGNENYAVKELAETLRDECMAFKEECESQYKELTGNGHGIEELFRK